MINPFTFLQARRLVTSERTRRMLKLSSVALLVVVFLCGILAGVLLTYSYGKIENARISVIESINAWRNFDLTEASKTLAVTEEQLLSLQRLTGRLGFLVRVPVIGKRVLAADTMVDSSLGALASYEEVIRLTEDLIPYRDRPYASIADKTELIDTMDAMIDALEQVYVNIQQMLATTHELGISDFAIVEEFETEFARFQEADFTVLRLLHNVISQRGEQNFLLLMQNNTELRPTGGYIGNFGILTLRDGEVPQFFLKDTDYLNEEPVTEVLPEYRHREPPAPRALSPQEADERLEPPAPLAAHFADYEWRFGDANWSPDFTQTARNAQQLYNIEFATSTADQIVFDGVIAFNPELVVDWLDILGGVKIEFVDKTEFSGDNFADTPQNLFPGDRINGKLVTEKTYIVNAIAQEVRNSFTGASFGLLLDMVSTLRHNLDDNNLFFYLNDPALQSTVAANSWSGELTPYERDYLMVVDANLSRLRLDHLVARRVDYRVREANGAYIAELTLGYDYDSGRERTDGLFDEVIGDYKTYTRVYAPAGASMIAREGVAEVDVYNELGRTVLGFFISVAPDTRSEVKITYVLPFIDDGSGYRLRLQKQSGNEFASYKVTLPLFEGAQTLTPDKSQRDESEKTAVWQGVLDESQEFRVSR